MHVSLSVALCVSLSVFSDPVFCVSVSIYLAVSVYVCGSVDVSFFVCAVCLPGACCVDERCIIIM